MADLVRQLFKHTPLDDSEMIYVKETLFGTKGGKPNNLWVNIYERLTVFLVFQMESLSWRWSWAGQKEGRSWMALTLP